MNRIENSRERTEGFSASEKALMYGFLLLVVLVAGLLLAAKPAHAAATTFTVNDTGDAGDRDLTDGRCDAYNIKLSGDQCTLRAAIQQANHTSGERDTIKFNISGSGVQTIAPTSPLPTITDPVVIDGYSQPGASPNTLASGGTNANLLIELNGANAGSQADGLKIDPSNHNTSVKGLVINRFSGSGINATRHDTAYAVYVTGNFIGTDASGTIDRGNGTGVSSSTNLYLGDYNAVNSSDPARRNLISGNDWGVVINYRYTRVYGNLIGTQKDGTSALGNTGDGVFSRGTDNSVGYDNTIAHNGRNGVTVSGSSSVQNSIGSNSIFSNGGLGIDLGNDGRTNNDPGDSDAGSNDLQNFPVIQDAQKNSDGSTRVWIYLSSIPETTFSIRFYANDPGADEGESFVGATTVTTSAGGYANAEVTLDQFVPAGSSLTATATNNGNTSEFSAPQSVSKSRV